MNPPAYFEEVRRESEERWNKLESDPVIAAPWRQLFRQIQSPRHVLSELLQNADDAGALTAQVTVKNGIFSFSHDGADFTRENFESLCRFGYSDKKTLHTIGFRGLGFKSTFSLGDEVRLTTPTLSVSFGRKRFTEPTWLSRLDSPTCLTDVTVRLVDQTREVELQRNLEDWTESPLSLLFFRALRTLQVEGETVAWETQRTGPVERSDWLQLRGSDQAHLVIRSESEEFPEDAVSEIRDERGAPDDFDLPPCSVSVVLGAEGRLFVVLPTGVRTNLPFAINAPFVQDPSRTEIKDPSVSPTNRWLLERAGRLAASAMLQWLANRDLPLAERACAYGLFPMEPPTGGDLAQSCARRVFDGFHAAIAGSRCVLAETGELVCPDESVIIPSALFNVWRPADIPEILGRGERSPVANALSQPNLQKLTDCLHVSRVVRSDVAARLEAAAPPKPSQWKQLVRLWAYLAPELTNPSWTAKRGQVHLVPVPGSPTLCRSADLVRLGEKRLLDREEDWQFLNEHVSILDQNWLRFLSSEAKRAQDEGDDAWQAAVESGKDLLPRLGLGDATNSSAVFSRFVERFSAVGAGNTIDTWVRIAEMAAALGASPPTTTPMFVTRDRQRRVHLDADLVYDPDGTVVIDHPPAWVERHVLHHAYVRSRTSCSVADWDRWVATHLRNGPQLTQSAKRLSRLSLETDLRSRGSGGAIQSYYSRPSFQRDDWDFEEEHWLHWRSLANDDPEIWLRALRRLLASPQPRKEQRSCSYFEVASNGAWRMLPFPNIPAGWIMKFRELPCLRDTRGFFAKPPDLLSRTPATDSLFGVVPFVAPEFDTPANRDLLVALGVGTRPNNTEHLLMRLRALSNAAEPPLLELGKLYEALDGAARESSPDELQALRETFDGERLVFTGSTGWTTSTEAFINADESDVPGAPVISPEVRHLSLWPKLGVSDRPTPEMALAWHASLECGVELPADIVRRVRALENRHPVRAWEETGRWLNLSSRLTRIAELRYCVSMQALTAYTGLFSWVRDVTANFQGLPANVLSKPPLSEVPTLASNIEERLSDRMPMATQVAQPWISTLAAQLSRIRLDDPESTEGVRQLAQRLGRSQVLRVEALQAVPHVGGQPAGAPRSIPALWAGERVYVASLPAGQLVKPLSDELAQPFERFRLADTIRLCYQRDDAFIREYIEATFDLAPLSNEATPEVSVPEPSPVSPAGLASVAPSAGDVLPQPQHRPPLVIGATEEAGAGSENLVANVRQATEAAERSDEAAAASAVELATEAARPVAHTERQPREPGVMERFAASLGLTERDSGLFEGPNGEILLRERGESFPWQLQCGNEPVRYYWPAATNLDRQPLVVPAPVWHLLQERPTNHFFVLPGDDDALVVLDGVTLSEMVKSQVLKLDPADYRLTKRADA